MTTEFKPNHNPTAEAILDFARSKDGPDFLLGFNADGNTYIQVDYYDPGAQEDELGSEVWYFDTHEAAMAVFLDLRNRMADETRKRTFRHQLEELQVSGRCNVVINNRFAGRGHCSLIFGRQSGFEGHKVAVGVVLDPGRAMKDQRSLMRLVDEVEYFISKEGL